jgi:hypothetical protein
MSPASGNTSNQTFTFTFSSLGSWQDLGVVNFLINNFIDGRNACYLAYVPSSGTAGSVYLVNDAGASQGPYAGLTLPGAGTAANSQCTINGTGSSASASGDTLTLTLSITFSQAFAGNKVVYMAAQNLVSSGWHPLGTWSVPGPAPVGPAVGGVNPARSNTASQTYAFTFTDTNGYLDLGVLNVLINDALDGSHACYIAYSRSANVLYLLNDTGSALLPAITLGSGSVANSQCTINGSGSSAVGNGNTLTLTLNITFGTGFVGDRVIYAAARSNGDVLNSGWQAAGSVTVP